MEASGRTAEGKRGATLPDSFLRGASVPHLSSGRDPSLGQIRLGFPRTPLPPCCSCCPGGDSPGGLARPSVPGQAGAARAPGGPGPARGGRSAAPPVPSAGRPGQRRPPAARARGALRSLPPLAPHALNVPSFLSKCADLTPSPSGRDDFGTCQKAIKGMQPPFLQHETFP